MSHALLHAKAAVVVSSALRLKCRSKTNPQGVIAQCNRRESQPRETSTTKIKFNTNSSRVLSHISPGIRHRMPLGIFSGSLAYFSEAQKG